MPRVALVVDDSMLIRHTVCRFLEERGFTVESATNGLQALEMMGELRPNIIITDMQMPKMDGSELIDKLKAKPECAAIPIVILAGKQTGADRAADTRADYVIFKDIDIETQLQKALISALGDPAVAGF
jgi:CheY-like chemotaxis protein